MNPISKLFASAVILMLSPLSAQAVEVSYDWLGGATSDGWTGSGEVVIHEDDYGATLDANLDFIRWAFRWTNGATTLSVDSNTGSFSTTFSSFTTDVSGAVTGYALCAGTGITTCSGLPMSRIHPNIFLADVPAGTVWDATTAPFTFTATAYSSSFGAPGVVGTVPLPGTLSLLAAGFLALGIRRRHALTAK